MLPADSVALGAPQRGVDVLRAIEPRRDTGTAKRLAALLAEESDNGVDEWEASAVHRAYLRADVTPATGDLDVKSLPKAPDHHRHFGGRDASLHLNAVGAEARSTRK
jgi:hypothetical protein